MPQWRQAFSQTTDILFKPQTVFAELAESQDLRPAWVALAVTSLLFAITSIVSQALGMPMPAKPILAWPAYRWVQAGLMPVILGIGCLLGTTVSFGLERIFWNRTGFRKLLAVSVPAILVPLWPTFWPTEMATTLGLLDPSLPGFPGLWTRELAPAFTFLYMLFLLWMALWQAQKVYLREAFALAVFSLLPVLGWWALILR